MRQVEGGGFGVEGGDQFVEGCGEAGDAFAFELGGHVVHVDADVGERLPHRRASSTSASTRRASGAMVGERLERGFGQRVDGVGADQLVDVERVGVRVVLGRRRRPQRPLHPGAACGERLPTGPRERVEEQLVGELALGDGGLAPQGERLVGADRLETAVDLGIDTADEEARDARHLRQVGVGVLGEPFEPGDVRLDHLRSSGRD